MAATQTQVFTLPKIKTSISNPNKIPIVQHLIRDEDVIPPEGELLQPLPFDKIIKLFVDPHSHHSTDRHLHSLKKISKHYHKGYPLRDVVKIMRILNILSDKIEAENIFIEDMCDLLQIYSFPFFKERASDEVSYESALIECMANLGYLLRTTSRDVRMTICETVLNLITFKRVPDSYANLQRCSKAFVLKTMRNSDLAETLVKSLTLMEDDVELRIKMMQILQIMSKDNKNCEQMITADCANRLILRVNYPKQNEELLFRTLEIIWNLVENGDQIKVAEQFNSLIAIGQLRDAFMHKALHGYSNYDRQLRNDILVISNLLASVIPKLPFIETGMAKQLLLLTTYPELKSSNNVLKNFKLTTCIEDFELKKLLFNFTVIICKNPTALQLISELGVLLALLSYVKPVETMRDARDWTLSQFEELQLHAMSALCLVIPLLLRDYFSCHGSTRLLLFLEWCTNKQNDYNGFGNSFHGKGGRGTKRAQLKYCLRVIRSIVSTGNEQAIQDLTDQDILSTMINILTNAANNTEPDDQIDVEIQSDMLFILATICENDLHRKELFGTNGVDILLKYLKKKPDLIWNGLGYQRLIIGTIDCIWSSVVGCMMNENYFMEREGVFCLLDILEASSKSMQNLILGCLLDLSDNVKSLAHFMQWEGKENQKISHLLCNLWRDEEKEIGVERDDQGVIINTVKPLASIKASDEAQSSLPANMPSRSIVEVSENMRAKIYGIFCKLSFADLPGLNQQDHITLCIIENYLDFKLGEVFKEINSELEVDKVVPVPPDQEALDTIIRAADERVISVNLTQKHMIETYKEQEDMQEKEFYYDIRKNFSFKERRMQEWKSYVERTSKYHALEANKEKQLTAIEDSRLPERETVVYQTIHNLEIPNLAVTAFCAPYIKIDSTPPELLKNLNNFTTEA